MSRSWYFIKALADDQPVEVSIYDEIGAFGITAQQFVADLKAAGDRRIVLRINSGGGSIIDGLAIYNRLRQHKGGVEVRIDGLAASMASVIAMAGDKVKMSESAFLMVHNPSGLVWGDAAEMRDTADLLDKMRESLLGTYERKTGLQREKLTAMLDAETWLTATEARTLGFVDEVTEPLKMAARFDSKFLANAPAHIRDRMNHTTLRSALLIALNLADPAEGAPVSDEAITARLAEITSAAAELQTLRAQFEALTATAADFKAQLATAQATITNLTGERDNARTERDAARGHQARLEQLCGVRGIDPTSATVVTTEAGAETKFDEWAKATGSAKNQLFHAHRTEILTEARSRGIAL